MAEFIDSVYLKEYDQNVELYPNHIFDWKMTGVNCATEDYSLGSTSEISFVFETDKKIPANTNIYVTSPNPNNDTSIPYGPFVFSVTKIEKKKSIQSRYIITCSCIKNLANVFDEVIEQSDLSSLPSNYTLMDLIQFASRGNIYFDRIELQNKNYVPGNSWWYQGLTYRQLYQWCCQLMGINDAGTLWLDNNNSYAYTGFFAPTTYTGNCINFNSNNVKSIDIAGYKTPVIDKVWFGNETTDVGFSLGTGEQVMMFPSNPLINPDDTTFLNPVYNKVHALQSYTPMRIETFNNISYVPEPRSEKSFLINGSVYAIDDLESAGSTDYSDMDPRGLYKYVWCHMPPNTNSIWGTGSPQDRYFPLRAIDGFLPYYTDTPVDSDETDDLTIFNVSHLKEYIMQCEKGSVVVLTNKRYLNYPTGVSDCFSLLNNNYNENCFMVFDYDEDEVVISKRSGAFNDNKRYKTFRWAELVYYFNNTYFTTDSTPTSGYYKYIRNIYFPSAWGRNLTKATTPTHDIYYNQFFNITHPTDFYAFPGDFEVAENKILTRTSGRCYYLTRDQAIAAAETPGQSSFSDKFEGAYLMPEGSSWRMAQFSLEGNNSTSLYQWLFFIPDDAPEPEPEPESEINIDITLSMLAWNYINPHNNFFSSYEHSTWMSFTDDKYNSYFCPIFNWEASPNGVILEGTGNNDRRIENSYLSYDLRTTGKYVDINNAILSTEGDVSGVTTSIHNLSVRVGNVEAAVNNKVEITDYNGDTIIDKINANGVTSIIDASRVDLSGYTPPIPSLDGDALIRRINAYGVTGTIDTDRLNLTGYVKSNSLATVATTGSYNDLINTPTIPAAQIQSDWAQATTTSVDYIKNKPTNVSDFTNDTGFVTVTDISLIRERELDSARTTYDNAVNQFEIPANKHFVVDVYAYKPTLSGSIMPTSLALLDVSGATPVTSRNVLKEVLATNMPSSDKISFTYVGHPSVTTTYYISLKTSSSGRVGYGYTGWYI